MVRHKIDIQLCQTVASDGETLKYQVLKVPVLPRMTLLEGATDPEILRNLHRLTLKFLLPKVAGWERILLFSPPPGSEDPFPLSDGDLALPDPLARIRYWLEKYRDQDSDGLGHPVPRGYLGSLIGEERALFGGEESGRPFIIPVYPKMTRLSTHYAPRRATFNTHFFLMELMDIPTPWDVMGEPFGLLILDGRILQPPLYGRESLIWTAAGGGHIRRLGVEDFALGLGGSEFRHGENARFFTRPEFEVTPRQAGTDFVIIGRRLVARNYGGGTPVPEAGFVCHVNRRSDALPREVSYLNEGPWDFGIQVGPALMEARDLKEGFSSPLFRGEGIPFPPTAYPLDWHRDRAARTGIGFKDDRLILICVEGSKAQVYRHGRDSTGASLGEFAEICRDKGVSDMINLDGGGSAQMSVYGKRDLKMSDRHGKTGEDFERPVPLGLGITLP